MELQDDAMGPAQRLGYPPLATDLTLLRTMAGGCDLRNAL